MTHPPPPPDRVRQAFRPGPRGVVGLVDDLLRLCQTQPLRLDFRDGRCSVAAGGVAAHEPVEVPLTRAVFRAVLARVAALCNDRHPGSVTPYAGEGELTGGDPPAVYRVAFTNTPAEQRLEVSFVPGPARDADRLAAAEVA